MPSLRTAFLVVVGLAGMGMTFHPTLFSGFKRMQPDPGDMVLNHYFLEHTYRWAFDSSYQYSFWSPGFYYPVPDTFTYSETLIGVAPLYWLFRTIFVEELASQLWMLTLCALNYAAMAIVLRRFGIHTILVAAGAFVFAFGLTRTDHLTHQQLLPQFFSPFVVWYVVAFVREPTARRWIAIIALGTAQLFASLHLGWFLGFGLMIFVPWLMFVEHGSFRHVWKFVRHRPIATIAPVLVAVALVAPYSRHFYQGNPDRRVPAEAAAFAPVFDDWIVAAPESLWADHLTPRAKVDSWERTLFQGFALYAVYLLAAYAAIRQTFRQHGLVRAGLGTALVMGMLVTWWGFDPSPWAIVHAIVPGANAFRAIGRIAFVIHLFGLIAGLIGFQAFVSARIANPRNQRIIYLLVAGLMMIEQYRRHPSFDPREQCYGPARKGAELIRGADAAHFVYDGVMHDYQHHITAMWAGLWADVPVMNGFSGTYPTGYPALKVEPTVAELVRLLGPNWHGRLVVVEWGPPMRRRVYQVETGGRYSLIESS
ncbi:MAG TPA: hypothetical protein VHR66_12880 [Gemmataceae bacterium]|jgi:hypothetical protein|nr:hypothetical protein [Gemmataceae bacterium]